MRKPHRASSTLVVIIYRLGIGGIAVMSLLAFMMPFALPRVLSWVQPEIIFLGDDNQKVLYLTIDDGPSSATEEIMSVLAKHRVPATFFIIGNHVHSDTQLSMLNEAGFSLGNHLRTTTRCSSLPLERFQEDFDFTDQLIHRFAKPAYFRPPSDFGTPDQLSYVRTKGYQPIVGTVFPLDHWVTHPAILAILVRWLAVPGGIIIMHDGDVRGHTTAKVLDRIIPILKNRGFTFEALTKPRPSKATKSSVNLRE